MRDATKGGESWPREAPSLEEPVNNETKIEVDPKHFDPIGTWNDEYIKNSMIENPFMLTWAPGASRMNVPVMTHGEGPYLVDTLGKRYLDWTSQAVCANLGHSLPQTIVEAAARQMSALPFVYGGCGITEVRVRLNQLIAEIMPGDLMAAVFPSSGAEANEAAIMMARRYTGKHKVFSWYRSYHGATGNAASATGDFRRWYGNETNAGFVKCFNPFPLFFNHAGDSEAQRVESALNMLEEQILNEGPDTIACMLMESVVGAGGVLVMPPGYMQGVRAMCTRYNIMMICDEVMMGFGRTGKMFSFQHYEGVIPDIVSAAKGISSASIPLSMTAARKDIIDFFADKPLGYGSTYQAHPVAMACAYENIKYLLQEDIVGQVQCKASLFEQKMEEMVMSYPCLKQYRAVGLMGCFDVQTPCGENPRLQHEALGPAFALYKQAFIENGLAGIHRFPHIHVSPPLNITEEQMLDGFERHGRAIAVLNRALGFPDVEQPPVFVSSCTSTEATGQNKTPQDSSPSLNLSVHSANM